MDLATWIEWIVKALIMIVVLLTGFAYTTYMERKFLARFQISLWTEPGRTIRLAATGGRWGKADFQGRADSGPGG